MFTETLFKKKSLIEEIVLIIVLLLSLIGIAITDFSPHLSHAYWTAMIVVFAFASISLGWSREEYKEHIFRALIVRQCIHWGATLLTVSGIYLLLQTGRLNYESAGLIIELILGFSLFLDGINLGWRFSLLGMLVGITAIIAAYVEEFIWLIFLVTSILAVFAFYWEKHHRKEV